MATACSAATRSHRGPRRKARSRSPWSGSWMVRSPLSSTPSRLLYSSRGLDDIIYASELGDLAARADGLEVVHTLTRSQPAGWTGYARRIDDEMLAEVRRPLGDAP